MKNSRDGKSYSTNLAYTPPEFLRTGAYSIMEKKAVEVTFLLHLDHFGCLTLNLPNVPLVLASYFFFVIFSHLWDIFNHFAIHLGGDIFIIKHPTTR